MDREAYIGAVQEIIQGEMTIVKASRQSCLTPSEIEAWVEDGKRGMKIFAEAVSFSSLTCAKTAGSLHPRP